MIRQAHTYLAGAVSGTALVGAAIVAFVMLVSFQALKDWPLAGISLGGDDNAAVGPAHPSAGATPGGRAAAHATGAGGVTTGARVAHGAGHQRGTGTSESKADVAPVVTPTASNPTATSPTHSTRSPANQAAPNNGSSAPAGSESNVPSGGNDGGGSNPTSPSGGGGSTSSSSQSTSGALTGAVNNTVSGVDQATGGVIGSTGVPKVTEEVVNNVAGPESTVGKTVDEVTKTVGGLLGGSK